MRRLSRGLGGNLSKRKKIGVGEREQGGRTQSLTILLGLLYYNNESVMPIRPIYVMIQEEYVQIHQAIHVWALSEEGNKHA